MKGISGMALSEKNLQFLLPLVEEIDSRCPTCIERFCRTLNCAQEEAGAKYGYGVDRGTVWVVPINSNPAQYLIQVQRNIEEAMRALD
jgi:hypothetical protein